MKYYFLQTSLTITILLLVVLAGAFRLRLMDRASRFMFVLLAMALLTESLACYSAFKYHNNNPIYDLFSIIEIAIVSLYFNYAITAFRKWNVGIYIGATGIIAGVINTIWFQPLTIANSNILFINGFFTIALSLFSIIQLLLTDIFLEIKKSPHFWIAVSLLFYWIPSLMVWLLYDHFTIWVGDKIWIVDFFLYTVGLLSNLAFGFIFLYYNKMSVQNEYR